MSETRSASVESIWDQRATIATVLIAFCLPAFGGWLAAGGSDVSATENRRLEEAPGLPATATELAAFPGRAEAYFDDHLGFRTQLIRANAWLHVAVLGVSPAEKLIVGKDGWFFFHHPTAVDQARGRARFTQAQLEAWRRVLTERRDWLADRGIAYLFVIAPNKHAVYPEYLPDSIVRDEGVDPHRQLVDHLRSHSDLEVVDLLSTMQDAKREERVYHKTDTHWNDRGAYRAYLEIAAAAARVLPDSPRVGEAVAVEPFVRETPGMGLTSIVGLSLYYGEEDLGVAKRNPRAKVKPEHRRTYAQREQKLLPLALGVEDPALPRALVFRDSFANALIPYLSENFRRIVFVWNRDIDPRLIGIEQPDIVIHEVAARFLDEPPKRDFSR